MSQVSSQPWQDLHDKLRFAAQLTLLLSLAGWIGWQWPFDDWLDSSGTPLGGDFVMYYAAGQAVWEGEHRQLYDDQQNQARVHALFPGLAAEESWPFRYPPTVAVAIAPLAGLTYPLAFGAFVCLQLGLLAWMARRWRSEYSLIHEQPGWLWPLLASPVVIETVLGGQASLLALSCATLAVGFLRKQNAPAAGAVLALALYKPNVLWLVWLTSLVAHPRMLLGFIPVTSLGVAVAIGVCGLDALRDYIQLSLALGGTTWSLETPYWKVHGLVPLLQAIAPGYGRVLAIAAGAAMALSAGVAWRRLRLDDRLVIGGILGCNAVFNPYVPIYDLVLLGLAALLLAQVAHEQALPIEPWQAQATLFTLFFGAHLSQSLSTRWGWQVFPLVLACWLGWYAQRLISLAKPVRT